MLSKHLLKLSIMLLTIISLSAPLTARTNFTFNSGIGKESPIGLLWTMGVRSCVTAKMYAAIHGYAPCDNDVIAPTFTHCPTNITVTTTEQSAIASWTEPTATDNCGPAVITRLPPPNPSGSYFNVGTTYIAYVATDAANNEVYCTFTITVINICPGETEPPVINNMPANITTQPATTCAVANWTEPTFSDNCTPIAYLVKTVTSSPTSGLSNGSCFPVGVTTVTYSVKDLADNIATSSFTVTVPLQPAAPNPCLVDFTPPVLNGCPSNIDVTTTGSCASVTWAVPTATDNCNTPSVTMVSSPTAGLTNGSCLPIGATTITYTATDAQGNTATCSFIITVSSQNNNSGTANLIGNNNGFEAGLAGFDNLGNLTTTSDASAGLMAAKIGTGTGGISFTQSVIANNTYTFKAFNKISGSASGALMGIKFFDASMNLLAGSISTSITYTSFHEQTLALIAPTNAATMLIYIKKTGSSGYIITDNWTLTATPPPCGGIAFNPNKYYKISNRCSGKKLKVSGGRFDDDAPTVQGDWDGEANQQWSLKSLGNGYFDVVAKHSGKSLSNKSAQPNSGCKQNSSKNDYSNDWKFECIGNGYYRITHRLSSLCMENYEPEEGRQSSLYQWDGGTYQQWQVEECNSSSASFSVVSNNTNNKVNTQKPSFVNSDITEAERMKDAMNRYARANHRPTVALKANQLSVFPNPTNDVANINLSPYSGKAVDLSLFNNIGQVVLTQKVASANSEMVSLDVSALPTGTYLMRAVIAGKGHITQRVVIAR